MKDTIGLNSIIIPPTKPQITAPIPKLEIINPAPTGIFSLHQFWGAVLVFSENNLFLRKGLL